MEKILVNVYKKYMYTNKDFFLKTKMKAVLQNGFGSVDVLYIGETDLPVLFFIINRRFQKMIQKF